MNITPYDSELYRSYRYGFNGMEKDNEVKGSGNSYDFGARMYDSRLGRWLSIDAMHKKYPFHSPYLFASNKPIIMVDIDGNESWPVVREWSERDKIKFSIFVEKEIKSIYAKRDARGISKNREETIDDCMKSENQDICFDCADFATHLLIEYAAQEGLEVSFHLANGDVVSSKDDEWSHTSSSGKEYHRKLNSKSDFKELVHDLANAESILADMSDVESKDVVPGDMTNSGSHVNVVREPNMSSPIESKPEWIENNIPTASASDYSEVDNFQGVVPRNASLKRKVELSGVVSYPNLPTKRWNVIENSSSKDKTSNNQTNKSAPDPDVIRRDRNREIERNR